MSAHLGDLLDTARRQRFVGRLRELASFDRAIDGRSPQRVLFVHGQGGIGKTTLLHEFRARARSAGRTVVLVDGREVDPSPQAMGSAVQVALDHQSGRGPDARPPAGLVLLVDGYEQLAPIDGWLRDQFVPGLGADNVVVLAGRDPPAAPWRTDSGWRHLTAVHHLDHFDPEESAELLAHAGVLPPLRQHVLMLGRGHPLTMALLADLAATGEVPDTLADAPDLISTLLESFLRDAPSEAHLAGLAICAIAWLTTEDLLARLVGTDAPAVWRWLASLPFVTSGPRGLFIHELARDVLSTEFERRTPQRYHTCRRVIADHAMTGLRAAAGLDRQLHAQQLFYLLRNGPLATAISALRARGSATVAPALPDEHDQVCSIIERFEGQASAHLAGAWLREQPAQLAVVRTAGGIAGFAYHLSCPSGSMLEERDPVVRAVLDHVSRNAPARPGELVDIVRFFAGTGEHQRDQYALLAGPVSSIIEWLTQPLAWSFVVVVDVAYWRAFFDHLAFAALVEVDIGGLRHVVYGIDWRRLPVGAWFDLIHERGHTGMTGPPPASVLRPPPLDRARFGAAVKAALQTLHRPGQLAANPLMGTSLAAPAPANLNANATLKVNAPADLNANANEPSVEQLRATIEDAVARLGGQPKGEQLQAVLHRTYLRAAPTQEAAAEVLDLPLSTYRRYLAKATEQLTDLLWTVEIGEVRLAARPDTT